MWGGAHGWARAQRSEMHDHAGASSTTLVNSQLKLSTLPSSQAHTLTLFARPRSDRFHLNEVRLRTRWEQLVVLPALGQPCHLLVTMLPGCTSGCLDHGPAAES